MQLIAQIESAELESTQLTNDTIKKLIKIFEANSLILDFYPKTYSSNLPETNNIQSLTELSITNTIYTMIGNPNTNLLDKLYFICRNFKNEANLDPISN